VHVNIPCSTHNSPSLKFIIGYLPILQYHIRNGYSGHHCMHHLLQDPSYCCLPVAEFVFIAFMTRLQVPSTKSLI